MGELLFMIILVSPMAPLLLLSGAWLGATSINKRPTDLFDFRFRGGYFSKFALQNDDVWDYARHYYKKICKKICIPVIFIADVFYILWFLLLKEYVLIPLIIFIVESVGYSWYASSKTTEQLNKTFDRQGKRREI